MTGRALKVATLADMEEALLLGHADVEEVIQTSRAVRVKYEAVCAFYDTMENDDLLLAMRTLGDMDEIDARMGEMRAQVGLLKNFLTRKAKLTRVLFDQTWRKPKNLGKVLREFAGEVSDWAQSAHGFTTDISRMLDLALGAPGA